MLKKPFTLFSLPSIKSTRQVIKKFPFPVNLIEGKYCDIKIIFSKGKVRVLHGEDDISKFSFSWLSSGWSYRDVAYALRLYLEFTKSPHSYIEENSSKITDCMVFSLNGLPVPDTVFVSRSSIKKNMPIIKKVCGFPLIIKDIKGSQGKHSVLVASESSFLEKIVNLHKNKRFLFQRYIPNEYDWGIMVANGVVVSGEKSYPLNGEFRNNTCNGATECFVDVPNIPDNIKNIAIKASKLLGLSWSRADIIIDKKTGLPYLLEVNRYPGITSDSSEMVGAYTFLASHILPLQ